MGVWGAGNFDSDAAADHAYGVVTGMVDRVEATVASGQGMEPDERSSAVMMA